MPRNLLDTKVSRGSSPYQLRTVLVSPLPEVIFPDPRIRR